MIQVQKFINLDPTGIGPLKHRAFLYISHSIPNFINKSDPQSAPTDQDPVTGASVVFRRRDKADLGVLAAPARLGAAKAERIAKYEGNMNMWVCLKIGYIPNYSHLIGIMIINHWV
jgi:hypothetical protein